MKQFLMTGIAALAFGATFVSCSHEEDLYDPSLIAQNEKEKAVQSYNAAFIKVFGQPAANQDWGFGYRSSAFTRASVSEEGNPEKYFYAPSVDTNEENDVVDYVRNLKTYPKVAPTGLKNYFVTQVHCSKDSYKHVEGGVGIVGSSFMENLHIAMVNTATIENGELSEGWQQITNFNVAYDTKWKSFTLVEDGGTFDFAYKGSYDGKYHNRWIAIDGKDIKSKYSNYWYICFDFEGTLDGYTNIENIQYYDPVKKRWSNSGNVIIPGKWTLLELGSAYKLFDIPVTHVDEATGATVVDRYVTVKIGDPDQVREIDQVHAVDGNIAMNGDNDYTDWIVRLYKARPREETSETHSYRVIAEDLNATEASDFDFNDVVFDVVPNGTTGAKIMLQAAGGIYKLTVNGHEVHEAFGEKANEAGTYPMINTQAGPTHDPVKLCTLYGDFTGSDAPAMIKDIVIKVYKPGFEEEGVELTATTGKPACKILVDSSFEIIKERTGIADAKTNFHKYVTGNWDTATEGFWWQESE